MKKIVFDIEKTTLMIERISRNRLILALFLIADGIIFLLNPGQQVEDMGRAVAMCMFFAAGAMIIAKIVAKERFIRFLPALIMLAAGGLLYFFPDVLSAYFRLLLALVIILNGTVNLLSILGVGSAPERLAALEKKVGKFFSGLPHSADLENGINEQTDRFLRPLRQIVSESKEYKAVFFATNLLAVILGVLLLVRADLSITIFGVIFIYVGISDFLLAYGTRKISVKLRDRAYREILFDNADEHEEQAEGNSEGRTQQN